MIAITIDILALILIAIICVIVGALLGLIVAANLLMRKNHKPVYMIKGMHDNYSKIEGQIKACKNKEQLRDAYLSIFAFEAMYPDSASFTSELFEKYAIKQNELAKQKEVVDTG